MANEVSEMSAEHMIRGIVQASLELAILRQDLCFEDGPPIVVEQCAEIVEDTWNAIRGIDTCLEEPVPEYTALLGKLAQPQPQPSAEDLARRMYELAPEQHNGTLFKWEDANITIRNTHRLFATLALTVLSADQGQSGGSR